MGLFTAIRRSVSATRILEDAVRPIVEAMEARQYMSATVSVIAADDGSETSSNTGSFTFSATGATLGDPSSVVVNYALSGLAVSGTDYSGLSGSVTLVRSGTTWTNATATYTPTDDSDPEGDETIHLQISTSGSYSIAGGTAGSADNLIHDNEIATPSVKVVPEAGHTGPGGGPGKFASQGLAGVDAGSIGAPGNASPDTGVTYPSGSFTASTGSALMSNGQTMPFGLTPQISNESFNHPSVMGLNAFAPEMPYLIRDGSYLFARGMAVQPCPCPGAAQPRFRVGGGGTWVGTGYLQATLIASGTILTMTDLAGNRTEFDDFSNPSLRRQGQFRSFTDAAGNTTAVSAWTATGSIQTVERRNAAGTLLESFAYTYTSDDLISNVAWSQGGTVVRQVALGYTGSGGAATLTSTTVSDGSSNVLDASYLRYYTSAGADGFVGGLQMVFGPDSLARLKTAYPSTWASESDANVAPYADIYARYDSAHRVSEIIIQGTGCSTCSGGLGSYHYYYSTNPATDPDPSTIDLNRWQFKTVEVLPDGSSRTIYANEGSEVMLNVFQQTASATTITSAARGGTGNLTATITASGHGLTVGDHVLITGLTDPAYNGSFTITAVSGTTFSYVMASAPAANETSPTGASIRKVTGEWSNYYQYDAAGRCVLHAAPSAVSGYWEAAPDLLTDPGAAADAELEGLRDTAGQIDTVTYGATTSANTSSPGNVAGYFQSSATRRGESGTQDVLSATTYIERDDAAGNRLYAPASETAYTVASSSGGGGLTTTMTYTWVSSSAAIESMTVTEPATSSTQNGSAATAVTTTFFNSYLQPTWQRDPDGYITYRTYDAVTGALTMEIDDVNTNRDLDDDGDDFESFSSGASTATAFTGRPTTWDTPASNGGSHLVTVFTTDFLGRTVSQAVRNGHTAYVVHNDATQETRYYPGWDPATHTSTGPTVVIRQDRSNNYTESMTMTATPNYSGTSGNYKPTGTESPSSIKSLSRDYYNNAGQLVTSDKYFNLSGVTYSTAANIGTLNTNYQRTTYGYDQRGRQKFEKNPLGTINWWVYDARSDLSSAWVGTDDTGAVNGDPDGSGGANDMKQVAAYEYDNGSAGGDGNLTKQTLLTDATLDASSGPYNDRVVTFAYDWRNRLVATKAGTTPTESDATQQRQIQYVTLDNLGRPTQVDSYDGDNVSITLDANSDGVPDAPSSGGRRAQVTFAYDQQGRLFHTQVNSVDQATGGLPAYYVATDTWHDARGNVIKQRNPGGLSAKSVYDGAGRLVKTFQTDAEGDALPGASGNFTDASTVTGDKVLQQTEYTYDADSNVSLLTTRDRQSGYSGTADLPTSPSGARSSFVTFSYDRANRMTATADYGTNGGTAPTAGAIPSRSDDVHVTSYDYALAPTDTDYTNGTNLVDDGRLHRVTDPRGLETKYLYDDLGRQTSAIEAWDGTSTAVPTVSANRTTKHIYDVSNKKTTLEAYLPDGADAGIDPDVQDTEYRYGVTTGGGSDINSNDMLAEVRFPDATSGTASISNKWTFTYNALGDAKTKTDQNGSTHTFSYDLLGRQTRDAVTTLGTGVNGNVRRIDRSYDTAGRVQNITSYDNASSGSAVNGDFFTYDHFGQLTADYQNHAGVASASSGQPVQYAYSYTSGASGNYARQTTMTYPDGRKVYTQYASGIDADISRVSSLADDDGSSGTAGTHMEEYTYLGLSTIISRAHPETGVDLTYLQQSRALDGDGAGGTLDPVTGLDRFGRVIDQRWVDYNSTATASDDVTTDRFQYGYDRDSNVLYKDDKVIPANSELYSASDDVASNSAYDSLNRLQGFQRGTLSTGSSGSTLDSVATSLPTKSWSLDALGNWSSVTTDSSTQTRGHNARNEVTSISGATSPTYDANGNTKTLDDGKGLTYDAWNHVITAADPSSGPTQRTYGYDGLGRRISETLGTSGTKTDRYYSAAWQDIEERVGSVVKLQNVFSEAYIDAIVLQDRDPDRSAGTLDSTFGTSGKSTAAIGTGAVGNAVAVQPDGKIVEAGELNFNNPTGDFAIARFNANGSLDTTFSGDGMLTVDFGGNDIAYDVAVQPDGKILVVGVTDAGPSGSNENIALLRLNADGSVDTAFNGDGDTDGKIIVTYGSGLVDFANGVALLPDGSFLTAGENNYGGPMHLAVMKFQANGAIDTTFGNSAIAGLSIAQFVDASSHNLDSWMGEIAVDPSDGDIVVGGWVTPYGTSGHDDAAVARFTSSGALDTTFGTGGMTSLDISGGHETIYSVVIQRDGKIVVAGGHSTSTATQSDYFIARLTSTGSLDSSFDSDGIQTTEFWGTGSHDVTMQIALQPDGAGGEKVVLAGYSSVAWFTVLRYNSNGGLDSTFDSDGKLSTDFASTWDTCNALAITPDGDLVVAGWTGSNYNTGGDFAVSRYSLGLQRFYVQQDANYNVTATTDKSGKVLERYAYDPYGSVTYLRPDGSVQADSFSDFGWNLNWQGARKEAYTGLYYFRNRDVSSTIGRAIEPDPWVYVNGLNMYQWEKANTLHHVDPSGTNAIPGPQDNFIPPTPEQLVDAALQVVEDELAGITLDDIDDEEFNELAFDIADYFQRKIPDAGMRSFCFKSIWHRPDNVVLDVLYNRVVDLFIDSNVEDELDRVNARQESLERDANRLNSLQNDLVNMLETLNSEETAVPAENMPAIEGGRHDEIVRTRNQLDRVIAHLEAINDESGRLDRLWRRIHDHWDRVKEENAGILGDISCNE